MHALERRTHSDAGERLIAALDDSAWELRGRAAQALHPRLAADDLLQPGRTASTRAIRNRVYWSVQLLCRRLSAQVIAAVMKRLAWADSDLRQLVIVTMANLRADGVGSRLTRYVADRSPARS